MDSPFRSGIGEIVSADIAVPEHDREVRFYAHVLTTGETPVWREDLMNADGTPIIGLGARADEYAHLPLQWMPHIQVADVAESVRRAVQKGGNEIMHAKGDDGTSQWAVLGDPDGAAFGIIPIVSEDEMASMRPGRQQSTDDIGHIRWADLTVPDAKTSRDFYQEVVGWTTQPVDMDDEGDRYADYNMCNAAGLPVAGICHARGGNAGLPTTWLLYLPVGDYAESLRRVQKQGGSVIHTESAEGAAQTYAIIRDPAGAHFALVPAKKGP